MKQEDHHGMLKDALPSGTSIGKRVAAVDARKDVQQQNKGAGRTG